MRRLASEKAIRFQNDVLLPQMARVLRISTPSLAAVRDALTDPYLALKVIYGHYAFARRGNGRGEYAELALDALECVVGAPNQLTRVFARQQPEMLWEAFDAICRQNGRKPNEQLNRGLLEGFMALATSIYEEDGEGNIFGWIHEGIVMTQRVEQHFTRFVEARGIGPKLASLILRDAVWMANQENVIEWSDRLYLQPVDSWVRHLAAYLISEAHSTSTADWVLAGKIAKAARRAEVSGINLNHGIQYFGNQEVRSAHSLKSAVQNLLAQPEPTRRGGSVKARGPQFHSSSKRRN